MILYEKLLGGKVRIIVGRYNVTGKSKKEVTESALEELERITKHDDRGYVACGDGTVLAIYWGGYRYGYDIVHPGIGVGSDGAIRAPSSSWGENSLEEAIQHAREHADQCFGGVVPGKVTGLGSLAPQ